MQFTQASVASTLLAVQDFIARHADRLGPIAVSGAKQQLDEIGAALEANGREQSVCMRTERQLTRKRDEARWVLINAHMYPISQVARMEIRSYATLTALQMLRPSVSDRELIQRAREMSVVAGTYSAVLLPYLVDENFIASLEHATEALSEILRARAECAATRQKATARLKTNCRTARLRIRIIDRFITVAVKDDAPLLLEWNKTKHVAMKAAEGHPSRVAVCVG